MTFSIVARDAVTGELGVAVSTARCAVGARCPFARAGVGAVATQAQVNSLLGLQGLALLEGGTGAEDALRGLVASDPGRELRQLHLVDSGGRAAAYTGSETVAWAGHVVHDGFSVAGNMLVGPEVLAAMAETFSGSDGPLWDRLAGALQAGQDAGGDKRGRQSAALLVVRGLPFPLVDVRVDDHADPVPELRRILGLYVAQWAASPPPHTR